MAVQYAPTKLKVPPGFQNLLEGLAREVLREQPENIIEFAANYFKNQLAIRNETGQDDAKKGADMEKLEREEEIDIDLDDPSTSVAATKIQAAFRGQQSRKEVKQKKEENDAATKIQAGFRGHQARKSVKEMKSKESIQSEDHGNQDESTEKEYVESVSENIAKVEETQKYDDEKYSEAATKIQAGFRGHKTREELKANSQENMQEETGNNEENDATKEEEQAALKIQASFRGHKARKEVEALKSSQSINDADNGADGSESGEKKDDSERDFDSNGRDEAATKIQSTYRGYAVRKQYNSKNTENDIHKADGSKSGEKKDDSERDFDSNGRDEAATKIQSTYRGYAVRKQYNSKNTENDIHKADGSESGEKKDDSERDFDSNGRDEAATKIQSTYRGYAVRKQYNSKNTENDMHKADGSESGEKKDDSERDFDSNGRDEAATKIQSTYRGYAVRKQYNSKNTENDILKDDLEAKKSEDAAVKIQAGYRGYVARKEVNALKSSKSDQDTDDLEAKKSEEAAVKIQAGYRGYVARKEVNALKSSKSNESTLQDDLEAKKSEEAAVKIQAGYRGYVARKEVNALKSSKSDQDKTERTDENEEEKAAIRIQASYRGYKTRASLKNEPAPQLDGDKIDAQEESIEEEKAE